MKKRERGWLESCPRSRAKQGRGDRIGQGRERERGRARLLPVDASLLVLLLGQSVSLKIQLTMVPPAGMLAKSSSGGGMSLALGRKARSPFVCCSAAHERGRGGCCD